MLFIHQQKPNPRKKPQRDLDGTLAAAVQDPPHRFVPPCLPKAALLKAGDTWEPFNHISVIFDVIFDVVVPHLMA